MITPTNISDSLPTSDSEASSLPFATLELTRLANEFFTAVPQNDQTAGLLAQQGRNALEPFLDASGASALNAAASPTIPSSNAVDSGKPAVGSSAKSDSRVATQSSNVTESPSVSNYAAASGLGGRLGLAAADMSIASPIYNRDQSGADWVSALPVAALACSPYYFLNELGGGFAEIATRPEQHSRTDKVKPIVGAKPRETPMLAQPASAFYSVDLIGEAPAVALSAHPAFDVHTIRRDFPILAERVNGRPLIWLDNAATTQKPRTVIDRVAYFYTHENSNIHRAAHELAARATDAYEAARSKVSRFLGASSPEEIIFVRGATEGINLIAQSWGRRFVGQGDEIIISHLEHHANIVPWQQLASEKNAKLRVIPVDDSGQILLEEYGKLLTDKTKLVAVSQVSNALGTIVPIKEIIDLAHRAGACTVIDGAQSVPHLGVNVQALDADFFVFSGHKIFGPTGIGVVYGKRTVLETMPPWQGGGNMITDVTLERARYQAPPTRFEAGTGNIADAVGLGAALDYVEHIGLENIARYEHDLLVCATQQLQTIPGLRLIGTARDKASVLSLVLQGYRAEDVGRALNEEGIAVRAGHHCAQPILRRFGLEATIRLSFAFYNTLEEVDTLIEVLQRLSSNR